MVTQTTTSTSSAVHAHSSKAPKPVGAYPHARKVGNLLFLSGVGPRQPETNAIPGGPVRDAQGNIQKYDVELQTRAVIENIKRILEESGSSLEKVFDVTVYLIDMDRDFATFNKVYAEYFSKIQATRTTLAVIALPTPIAVEFKVIATL
ncbi:MAG: RidA family protein [Bdellovibrionales bacterium]